MDDDALFEGPAVTLDALLAAREARVVRRDGFLDDGAVVVGVSVVMPGAVKDCALSRGVAQAADAALAAAFDASRRRAQRVFAGVTAMGPEAFWRVEGDARDVKRAAIAIEATHPLGRLFDLDVETRDGPVSRATLGAPARACLVCGGPARECGRARRHSPQALRAAMIALYRAHEDRLREARR
jgi:holo-ACP synthase